MIEDNKNRLSRLTAILIQLQTKRVVTAGMLAARFAVSVRTIYRDIRALEQSGVPILTEEGKGYSLMEGYRMAPVTFTESEANALITAEQLVLKNKDSSFIKDYTDAITKIKAVLRPATKDNANLLSGRIAFSQNTTNDRTSNYLSALQLALTNFNLTDIVYQKAGAEEPMLRTVEPFALLCGAGNWVMGAWCHLRKEFRLFRLDRIQKLRVRTEKFEPHKLTMQEYLQFLSDNNPS